MQAMPTMPVDPAAATTHVESRPVAETVSDENFSQHLTAANENIDNPGKNKKPDLPATESSGRQSDLEINNREDFLNLAMSDIQLNVAAQKDQKNALLNFIRNNSDTNNPISTQQNDRILTLLDSIQTGWSTNTKNLGNTQQNDRGLTLLNSIQTGWSAYTKNLGNTQQNDRIITLLDSIQVKDTQVQQSSLAKPITTLGTLLENALARGNENQTTVTMQTGNAESNPSTEPRTPALTIESWRAQFSYQNSTNAQGTHTSNPGAVQSQQTGQGNMQEPVLAYISPETDKISPVTHPSHGSRVDFPNQPRDANSNYIHSNLPGVNVQTEGEGNKNTAQQNGDGQKNTAKDTLPQQELATTAKTTQDTPLIFTLGQEKTTGLSLMPQSQTTSTSLMLRLPSGTEVPQSHVINQVINRFTLNRTLESGSITLKLYPEELGELRMEIKVEQDNIKAHITTQNPQVQEILERQLPRLREALEQQGLNLEQLKVTVAADDGSRGQLFQEHFDSRQPKQSQRSSTEQVAFPLDQPPQDEGEVVDKQQNLSVLI